MSKEKPSTKICKHCATEIPYEAKVCPNCRKKVKGGKLKWIALALIVLIVIGAMAGGSDDAEPQETEVAQDTTDTTNQEQEEVTEAKIEYAEYNCTELFDDLKDNALKAEKKHQDEYVKIKGYLATIDSDGEYIGIGAAEEDYDYMFQEIQCSIKSDEQLDKVLEMSSGDEITVMGKVTSVGEVLGYDIDIIEIK